MVGTCQQGELACGLTQTCRMREAMVAGLAVGLAGKIENSGNGSVKAVTLCK